MCGLVGLFLNKEISKVEISNIILGMNDTLIHRGPDNSGLWMDSKGNIALAHRRLSILDLTESGNQPMISSSKKYILVFNGEIYNHLSIRVTLQNEIKKINWNGFSDTETLLFALEYWGLDKTLKNIRGMFAFALWDNEKKKLTIAKDCAGEKPLYYGWVDGNFIFASELRAITKFPNFKKKICKDSLSDFLKFSYVPSPKSIYENIYKLEAGNYLEIDLVQIKKKEFNIRKYWSIEDIYPKKNKLELNDTTNYLHKLIENSVKAELLADVPLGAFLSGGIDSSLVVALMQKNQSKPVKTFTVGFENKKFDESIHSKKISKYLNTDHNEFILTQKKMLDIIPNISKIYDEPFADSSQIPTYFICKEAKKKVSVILSGDGGDELFGGYNRYKFAPQIWFYIKFMPIRFRNFILKFLVTLQNNYKYFEIGQLQKLYFSQQNAKNLKDFFFNLTKSTFDSDEIIKNYKNNNFKKLIFNEFWKNQEKIEYKPEQIMMNWDIKTYLIDDILCKIDRAAMANSLETRVPFLDRDILEFSTQIPTSLKIKNNKTKWLLRKILNNYLPNNLIDRPKSGFSIPLAEWLRGPLRDWVESLLNKNKLDEEGFFNSEIVLQKWQEHLSGKYDWSNILWNLLIFQDWQEKQKY